MRDKEQRVSTVHLVEQIANKDARAYTEVFRRYAPRVKAYLLKRGVAGGLAEELTQEVMLTLWQKASSFDERRGQARAWIFRVTRNALVDSVRRGNARPKTDELTTEPAVPVESFPPHQVRHDARKLLGWAVDNLSADQVDVLRLAYLSGFSSREIAEQLGIPTGTVKSRLRLALRALTAATVGER